MLIWSSLLIYIIFLRLLIGNLKSNKNKIIFLLLSSIGISFIMGVRSSNFFINDLSIYYNYYEYTTMLDLNTLILNKNLGFEHGYIILNKILSSIISWPQFIIIVEAIICTSCVSIFIYRNSENVFDSIIFYLSFGIMKFQLTGFRQAIAMSICLLSVEFIKKRKFIPFITIVLLASTFHKSAIVFLILYFLGNKKFNSLHYLFLFSLLIFCLLFKEQLIFIFNTFLNRNYNGYDTSQFGGIGYILIYVTIIIMSFISKKSNNDKYRIGINMTWIAFIFYIFRYNVTVAERISYYFAYGAIVSLPNLYYLSPKKQKNIIRIFFIIFACILYFHKLDGGYSNYTFFWQ